MAAGIGDTAQVNRDGRQFFGDQSRQPGLVCRAIGDRKVLHDVVVEDHIPRAEGSSERLQASARHVKVRAI